jgi:hypothetical protein
MDQRSTLDLSAAAPAERHIAGGGVGSSAPASVSAGIAEANAHLPKPAEIEPRFPAEDGGRSLAEVAHRDLEAALQLLAERAQYITGASGAAIALRRGEHNDMLCRASAGTNAPELGALLSMEYGLSGESVRTRQALRCDDAERDPRVNREGCREMGIASVVVMPIVSEQQVLGVFELFSSTPHAFEERDLLALQRLSEMVETAVRHAVAAQGVPRAEELAGAETQPVQNAGAVELSPDESTESAVGGDLAASALENEKNSPPLELESTAAEKAGLQNAGLPKAELPKAELQGAGLEKAGSPAVKNPQFWSASALTPTDSSRSDDASGSLAVPTQLRDLQRCKACGFPVSRGRTLCVECEEKQLRGEQLPQPVAKADAAELSLHQSAPQAAAFVPAVSVPEISALKDPPSADTSSVGTSAALVSSAPTSSVQASCVQASSVQASGFAASEVSSTKPALDETAITAPVVDDLANSVAQDISDVPLPENSTLFLSSAAPSESWLAANKYVLGVLLVVAVVIALIVWLR